MATARLLLTARLPSIARLLALAVVALAAGCSSSPPAAAAHPVAVRAGPFALAEVARRVGLDRVTVSATTGLALTVTTDAWTDPVAMERVTQQVADELIRADPAGSSSYQAAARAYQAQLGALDIDYRSSLADCARHSIVTADAAFASAAARYNFMDHVAAEAGIARLIQADRIPVLFTEPGAPTGPIDAMASAAGTKVEQLDTLDVRTPDETARHASYLSLMTDNLAKLRIALACTASS